MLSNNNLDNKLLRIESFYHIIDKYDYFVFDCDGVIWTENEILSSTVKAIQKIIEKNKKVFFLSNNNKISRIDFQDKFKSKCGLDISYKFIYNSSFLISKYISENYPEIKHVYVIGKSGIEKELEEKGIIVYGGSDNKNIKYIENFSEEDLDKLEINENIQACLCGYDDKFNFFKLTYAMNVINKTGLFFGTNQDRKLKRGNNFIAGSYTFISALETCTEKKAQIVTKPDPRSLEIIMSDHNINLKENRERILMIGDNLKTDISFANNNNIDSLLVLTGVTREEDLEKLKRDPELNSLFIPKYVLDYI